MLPAHENSVNLPVTTDAPPLPAAIPPLLVQAQAAFRRDLAHLLHEWPGRWVAYHGSQRIGTAPTDLELYEECRRRGLADDEYLVLCIEPEVDVVTFGLLQVG